MSTVGVAVDTERVGNAVVGVLVGLLFTIILGALILAWWTT